jgi:hypothetical protein
VKHIRKRWQFWLGMGISLVLAAWLVLNVDMDEVLAALRQMNVLYLVPATLIVVVTQVARAYRWRLMFYPRQGLRITKFFNIMNIGYLLNNLPARAGDLTRPVLLHYAEGTSVAGGLSTILVERLLDTLTIVLLLFGMLPFVPVPPEVQGSGVLIAAALITLAVILVLLSFQRELGRRLLLWLAGRITLLDRPSVYSSYDAVIDSLVVLRSPWPGLGILALTAIIWALATFLDYFLILAFDPTLPLAAAILVLCFTGLSMTVPASPSNIGTFHWAVMLALMSVFGMEKDRAFAIAVVLHAFSFGVVSIIGLVCMWAESLSYGDITRRISEDTTDVSRLEE